MGDAICDECGEQPYCGLPTTDYTEYNDHSEQPDVEIWCECPEDVPIVFDTSDMFEADVPDCWGESGARFVCYECGEMPRMHTSTKQSHPHPITRYHLSCGCEYDHVGFTLRDIMPNKWKKDMDQTKWPDKRDDIKAAIDTHGPMCVDEIAEHVDLPVAGIDCLAIHMDREDKLYMDRDSIYYTFDHIVDSGRYGIDENGLVEKRSNHPDVDDTGIRSGKGSGLFSRLLGFSGEK